MIIHFTWWLSNLNCRFQRPWYVYIDSSVPGQVFRERVRRLTRTISTTKRPRSVWVELYSIFLNAAEYTTRAVSKLIKKFSTLAITLIQFSFARGGRMLMSTKAREKVLTDFEGYVSVITLGTMIYRNSQSYVFSRVRGSQLEIIMVKVQLG